MSRKINRVYQETLDLRKEAEDQNAYYLLKIDDHEVQLKTWQLQSFLRRFEDSLSEEEIYVEEEFEECYKCKRHTYQIPKVYLGDGDDELDAYCYHCILHRFSDMMPKYSPPLDLNLPMPMNEQNLLIYAQSYNVLRIMSGMSRLSYTN